MRIKHPHLIVFSLAFVLFGLLGAPAGGADLPVHSPPGFIDGPPAGWPQVRVEAALRSSPVMFIENVGQFDAPVRFQVRGGIGTMWLAEDAIWITRLDQRRTTDDERPMKGQPRSSLVVGRSSTQGVHLKLTFPGANPHSRVEPFDRLNTVVSYFIGNDPERWHPDVPVWAGVRYVDLYPGIDLEITSQDGRWTWRLVCRANCQFALQDVWLRIEGADALAVGPLSTVGGRWSAVGLITTVGDFTLPLLEAVTTDGMSLDLAVAHPRLTGNEIRAPFKAVDTQDPMHIQQDNPDDLLYSTFLGGSAADSGAAITVDQAGNTYVTGSTSSSDFPTTVGAFDTNLSGSDDAFVIKLNPDGSSLAYATFLGGSSGEGGEDIAVDGAGSTYVMGSTNSSDFPTTVGAFDTSFNGGPRDAFVVKLNATGSALTYATFLGGSNGEWGRAIAVDGIGSTHVTGNTSSSDFPTTVGAFDTSFSGSGDAFVVKLNTTGSALAYATFLGGSSNFESGEGVAIDGDGAAYVTGYTDSSDFPTTAGSFDTNINYVDVFVVKLNTTGTGLSYATFLGGSFNSDFGIYDEYGWDIAVDDAGNAYVTGETGTPDFPTTTGAFDITHEGGHEAFAVKLNASGTGLSYSTFLGGRYDDRGFAIAVDEASNAYVTGWTNSPDFPTTEGAFDTSLSGFTIDGFIVKLNTNGTGLAYGTFLGGAGNWDVGYTVAVDGAGSAYVMGDTDSSDFPSTAGAFDISYNGGADAFVAKLVVQQSPHCPDLNGDGVVDIVDLQLIIPSWHSTVGDPGYNPDYDLDGDGDIDVLDVQTVAYYWGTTCAVGAMAAPPRLMQSQPVANLTIQPASLTVSVGQTFTVGVAITNAADLGAFEFDFGYNPDIVEVENVNLDEFPGSSGREVGSLGPVIDNEAGTTAFGAISVGSTPDGPSGNGLLAVLTLRALAEGESDLQLTAAQVGDPAANPQSVTTENGRVSVAPSGNPVPAVTGLSPDSVTAGDPAFTLTVNGTDFVSSSVVRWNGLDRTTTFVSSTQLQAQIEAADIATAGTASVTVFNPGPGGGTSNALTFTINPPSGGDPYEPDNTCATANAIPPNGDFQAHNFHTPGDADWLRLNATADTYYIISALHVGDDAHAVIRLYDQCEADPFDVSDTFGFDQIITFRAERNGLYYIELQHLDPNAYGDDTAYRVSVRPVTTGVAIIVGGRLHENEEFQQQITFMTDRAYRTFFRAGYDHDDIYYMSADPNPPLHMDAPSRPANLSYAIHTWAAERVADGEPLYIYLADHGENEFFFLDTGAHKIRPDDLDEWLLAFEEQRPNSPVVVIIEACRSGSFVTPLGTISHPGRVIVTAAGENTDAYVKPPGQGGAYFSDAFFSALAGNYDVWQSYQIGRQVVGDKWGDLQTPWVDGNGNGVPYPEDGDDEGAGRSLGLGRLAALSGGQPPFIERPTLPPLDGDHVMRIEVKVLDENLEGTRVWMEVTKPSTPPPSAPAGYITPVSHAELVELGYNGTSGRFEVEFEFDEVGAYQLVFNAEDAGGQRAQAVSVSMVRDVTGDGVIDMEDVQKVAGCWRQAVTEPDCQVADINNDAVINIEDVMLVVRGWTSA